MLVVTVLLIKAKVQHVFLTCDIVHEL